MNGPQHGRKPPPFIAPTPPDQSGTLDLEDVLEICKRARTQCLGDLVLKLRGAEMHDAADLLENTEAK